jgi:hypothetical protein
MVSGVGSNQTAFADSGNPPLAFNPVPGILYASGLSLATGIITSPVGQLNVYNPTSGAIIFNAEGTNGSLFSIVDNLSGSLMSVNNNAGLPVFEVFSDDRVVAGRFGQNDFIMTSGGNVGIGTGVPSSKFHVVGTSTFNGDVSSTGSFIGGSGTAALPSFEFINDPDTGLFSPATNNFGISTSGVERLRINSSGNVGIGTTAPSVRLQVDGNIRASGLQALVDGDYINVSLDNHGHQSVDISTTLNNNDFGYLDDFVDSIAEGGYQVALGNILGGVLLNDCSSANVSNLVVKRDGSGDFNTRNIYVTGIIANSGNFTNSLQLNGSGVGLYDTSVFNLGTISGTNAINCGQDRQIQTLTLNGVATTFTTGTGWPSSNSVSRETTLNIFASGNTSVTWTIVNDWYRQPDSPLPSGRHIVLLRSVGSGTMQGHYIGNKTN